MKTPCANCPFRSDRRFYLPADRVLSIGAALANDGSFTCHKDQSCKTPCIGAVSVLDRESDALGNCWVRIGIMCDEIEYPIAHDVPVYSSFEEAAAAMSGACLATSTLEGVT